MYSYDQPTSDMSNLFGISLAHIGHRDLEDGMAFFHKVMIGDLLTILVRRQDLVFFSWKYMANNFHLFDLQLEPCSIFFGEGYFYLTLVLLVFIVIYMKITKHFFY